MRSFHAYLHQTQTRSTEVRNNMINKTYHTLSRNFPNSYKQNFAEIEVKSIPSTHIYTTAPFHDWYKFALKKVGAKLDLLAQPSLLSEMIRSLGGSIKWRD